MSVEQDLIKLYSKRILSLAASIPNTDRLVNPDATARKRSPLCGSNVTVDISVKNGRVVDFGQDVKACALGQAAASVVSGVIKGRSLVELKEGRAQLCAMLKENGAPPLAPFDELEVLLPARAYPNRHASILLALDAAIEAFSAIENSK